MAALDYGMALARGLIAPQKELQAEVKKLAGNSFRTDEWWNKQLDRQIKEGISETKQRTEYLRSFGAYNLNNQPNYWAPVGTSTNSGYFNNTMPYAVMSAGYFNRTPQTRTVSYQEQRDLTAGELKAIENQSKDTSKKVKSAARRSSKAEERKVRGTGGLMGRVKSNDRGLSAKLPELGSMGLGINKTFLG
jgi:hypothetical protein